LAGSQEWGNTHFIHFFHILPFSFGFLIVTLLSQISLGEGACPLPPASAHENNQDTLIDFRVAVKNELRPIVIEIFKFYLKFKPQSEVQIKSEV
jgi:hypothetical protein